MKKKLVIKTKTDVGHYDHCDYFYLQALANDIKRGKRFFYNNPVPKQPKSTSGRSSILPLSPPIIKILVELTFRLSAQVLLLSNSVSGD